jgi:hypothetical protein
VVPRARVSAGVSLGSAVGVRGWRVFAAIPGAVSIEPALVSEPTGHRAGVAGRSILGRIQKNWGAVQGLRRRKCSAGAGLAAASSKPGLGRWELESHRDLLGEMSEALDRLDPEQRGQLLASPRLSLAYRHVE